MNLPDPKSVKRVTIISTGVIGSSWAVHFLGQGMEVTASNPGPDAEAKTRAYLEEAWPALERLGTAPGASHKTLRWCSDSAEAVDGAQFVQESGPERMNIKASIYGGFEDALGPDAVMATSSSGLLVSELQEGRKFAERFVLGHPFNPPHLVPLVEVLGGKKTDPQAVEWAMAFYNAYGKKAIRLNHELRGHLANRLQAALYREAVDAVATGFASVQDVDTAIAYGPGLRWALNGPHEVFEFNGGPGGMSHFLEHLLPALESWWAVMHPPSEPIPSDVKEMLIAGNKEEGGGRSTVTRVEERDELLVTLLVTLAKARRDLAGRS